MARKQVVRRKYLCPKCGKGVKYGGALFGVNSSVKCPHCGHTIMGFVFDEDYKFNFRVAGGSGAANNPRKYTEERKDEINE